jgi:hypothetical protein
VSKKKEKKTALVVLSYTDMGSCTYTQNVIPRELAIEVLLFIANDPSLYRSTLRIVDDLVKGLEHPFSIYVLFC